MHTTSAPGSPLRAMRERRGLRQRELAKIVRCSAGYLREIETGRRVPSPVLAHRIAMALDVPVEEVTTAVRTAAMSA